MILCINSGSSSIKFSFFKTDDTLSSVFYGDMESIGTNHTVLSFTNTVRSGRGQIPVNTSDYGDAVSFFIEWLTMQQDFKIVKAIGHRIVHGMQHTEPEPITTELINYLKGILAYDSEHLPQEIKLIELFLQRFPLLKQVACFDTAFHSNMPMVAKLLSIPRRYFTKGIQHYGFHGLSYSYLMEELERLAGNTVASGKIILAHLGSGASLAAVKEGKSIDTSMGFTPSSGLIMSTRTGDLDPGIATYLMEVEKLSPQAYSHLVNHESGLLGISETSSGMREL
ncbi:MAG: acetate/propionate family kinase, partial [Azospira oryzae]